MVPCACRGPGIKWFEEINKATGPNRLPSIAARQ